MRLWRMGAQRYDRAVLRGVLLFRLGSDVLSLFKLPEEVQYDSSPSFLPDNNELSALQERLYAVGVVTTRRSRSRGVSPR